MKVFTIGFTKKTAEAFFRAIQTSGARRVVDVRLNNVSQLAGFSKRDDIRYFLRELCGLDYVQLPELAPTPDILDRYRKSKGDWATYEGDFLKLMETRRIDQTIARDLIDEACLLCSEDTARRCHRRLVAEYLCDHWGGLEIIHLT